MMMKFAGINISDDAVHYIEYSMGRGHPRIKRFAAATIPRGLVEGGDFKDEKALITLLSTFEKENNVSYVKVSVPEEKAYLFQTDVPAADVHTIGQNIEFKLDQNVPLSAADAIFYFDLLPAVAGGPLRASVSVVPRSYIEHYIEILRSANMVPVAFEIVPKAIARAIVPQEETDKAVMIVHIMDYKTGVYIVSGGVVCFTSTVSWGSRLPADGHNDISILAKEMTRITAYWLSHGTVNAQISEVVLVGKDAAIYENTLRTGIAGTGLSVTMANVWRNIFDLDSYIPPISRELSLDYAVAAGLAMEL